MRLVIVCLADTHAGHRLGLANPQARLGAGEESAPVPLTKFQGWLWEQYLSDVRAVREFAGRDALVLLHLGDVVQGVAFPQAALTASVEDQAAIAVMNFEPWAKVVREAYLVTGTPAHDLGESGDAPRLVARQLPFPAQVVHHLLYEADGVMIDAAHHGPAPGVRVWTRGNVARLYLQSLLMQEVVAGNPPPRLVLRAHRHEYVREAVRYGSAGAEIAIIPSYCGLGGYARMVRQSPGRLEVGMVAVEIVNGEVGRWLERIHYLDLRTRARPSWKKSSG